MACFCRLVELLGMFDMSNYDIFCENFCISWSMLLMLEYSESTAGVAFNEFRWFFTLEMTSESPPSSRVDVLTLSLLLAYFGVLLFFINYRSSVK